MVKELLKAGRVVLLSILAIAGVFAAWCGLAWALGWTANRIYGWEGFSYVGFGSLVLSFTLAMQILAIICTCLVMIAWGRVGFTKKRSS